MVLSTSAGNGGSNHEETPDIIFYPEIFNDETIEKTTELLQSLSYNKNGERWLTDDPTLSLGKELPAKPFPALIELIRNDIEKITGHSFNSCLIQALKRNEKKALFTEEVEWVGDKYIIPSVFFGSKRIVQFESLDNTRLKKLNVKPGSLLIQREKVYEFWNVDLLSSDNDTFYNLVFNRLYPPEKNSLSDCKKVPIVKKSKLPYDLDIIYTKVKCTRFYRSLMFIVIV